MIALLHDQGTNTFYIFEPTLKHIKGLEHGDIDGMVALKADLSKLKVVDLKQTLPHFHLRKIYQINSAGIFATVEASEDASSDPEAWQPRR